MSSSKGASVTAAISRAKTRMERQSGRLGVTSTSSTRSVSAKRSTSNSPASHASGSTMMPGLLAARPNSASDRIIPADGTPRSLASLMRVPSGMTPPGKHDGRPSGPAATLGAPHTMVRARPRPRPQCRPTACRRRDDAGSRGPLPTTKRLRLSSSPGTPTSVTRSTSVPVRARREDSSSTVISMGTYSRSQDRGAFIMSPVRTGAKSAGRSQRRGAGR